MRKASHRTNAAGSHLQEVSEVAKLTETESQMVVTGARGREKQRAAVQWHSFRHVLGSTAQQCAHS